MKHLVIIGLVLPEPASTAAGKRMMQLIEMFKSWDYRITFLTSATPSDFSESIDFRAIQLNDSSFDQEIKLLNPDVVLFDRYISEEQFGWRVSENCPNAIKILDTEDLHFLRQARRNSFTAQREFNDEDFYNEIFNREIASILRCDLSLIISAFEYQLLTEKFKINPETLFYIPFLFDGKTKQGKSFQERKHFVSIGNFFHEPNWQTVLQLKKIWKNIRKELPESELHIYGAYASEKVFQLHNENEGFLVKGRASSVEEIFSKYKILLAPIPFGAGLKGKLFESMIFGIPNVTTKIGAEGMFENDEWNGFIEDDLNQFAQKSVELYQNENLWKTSQQNGFEILTNLFDENLFVEKLLQKIHQIAENLQQHRNANFLGKILQQNQMNAVKFMSRWIEEKNKK